MRLAVEASSTPARRAFQPERLAQLPKFGRAAMRAERATKKTLLERCRSVSWKPFTAAGAALAIVVSCRTMGARQEALPHEFAAARLPGRAETRGRT